MARNIDDFITPTEHSAIDHTGIPGTGGGGGSTIVGARVLFADDNPAGQGTVYSLTANTLTADNQSLEITLNFSPGTGSDPDWSVTLGGQTLINWTSIPVGTSNVGFARIRVFRTGATTGRASVHAWVAEDDTAQAGLSEVYSNAAPGLTLDWSTILDLDSLFSGGTGTSLSNFHVLQWPQAGALGVSGIGSDTLPTGTIVPYAGTVSSVPAGFLPCDGSLADETVETELFAVIGSTWNTGGEPAGFFRLPDLRAKSVLGLNDGTLPNGADGGFSTRNLADTGGSESGSTSSAGAHVHTQPDSFSTSSLGGSANNADSGGAGTIDLIPAGTVDHDHSLQDTDSAGSHSHTTSRMHPFAVCPYIIKSQQVGGGLGVTAQNNGGALTGTQPTLNFIPTGGAGVSVVEDSGNNRLDITISAPTAGLSSFTNSRAAVSGTNTFTNNLSLNSGGSGTSDLAIVVAAGAIRGDANADTNRQMCIGAYEFDDPSGVFICFTTGFATFSNGSGNQTILGHPDGTRYTVNNSGGGGNPAIDRSAGSSDFSGFGLGLKIS